MRNQTRLAPREPFDVTVHMVLKDFGPLGRWAALIIGTG